MISSRIFSNHVACDRCQALSPHCFNCFIIKRLKMWKHVKIQFMRFNEFEDLQIYRIEWLNSIGNKKTILFGVRPQGTLPDKVMYFLTSNEAGLIAYKKSSTMTFTIGDTKDYENTSLCSSYYPSYRGQLLYLKMFSPASMKSISAIMSRIENFINQSVSKTVGLFGREDYEQIQAAYKLQRKCRKWLWAPVTNDGKLGINMRLLIKDQTIQKFGKADLHLKL